MEDSPTILPELKADMTYISLFSGIGGLDLAVESVLDTKAELYVEFDKFARKILLNNNEGAKCLDDAREIDYRQFRGIDGIIGGWPCQPHSLAGKRLGDSDKRDMWPTFIRAIREIKPRWVLGENVKGILSSQKGEYFGGVLRDLAQAGYDANWLSVRASEIGAPHLRERVFILATSNSDTEQRPFDSIQTRRISSALADTFFAADPDNGRGEQYSQKKWTVPVVSADYLQSIADSENPEWGVGGGFQQTEKGLGRRGYPGQSPFYWGEYQPSIDRWTMVRGTPPYPLDENRRLTPRFIEWIMGFPLGWTEGVSRTQALRGLGNAVVPLQGAFAFEELIFRSTI